MLFHGIRNFRAFYRFARSMHAWNYALNFAKGQLRSRWKCNLALAFSAFSFEKFGVSDEELGVRELPSEQQSEKWEFLYENSHIKAYRRRIDEGRLYEYRCEGSYEDISPDSFMEAQVDVNYRQLWDENVIKLEVLKEDEETGSQLVRWVAKFPYPMYPRLYIFVSRRICDYDKQQVTIVNKALGSEEYASSEKNVRVVRYKSTMVVRAHSTLSEKGLDYTLTYYEDSLSSIPSVAYNYMVNRMGPYFLQRVHQAAKVLESRPNQKRQCYSGKQEADPAPDTPTGVDTPQIPMTTEKSEEKISSDEVAA